MLTLYDAPRCPFCARARIVLAEKGVPHETVIVDLAARPEWIIELNPPYGKVPVLDDGGWVLPESAVIDEYLEERFPDPPLLPDDPGERAAARLLVFRFDNVGDAYYGVRRGREGAPQKLDAALADLDRILESTPYLTGREFGLADVAYVPWILRARDLLDVSIAHHEHLAAWLERLLERPSIAAEAGIVATL